jgi:uncharacterized protein (TIGR02271 family)
MLGLAICSTIVVAAPADAARRPAHRTRIVPPAIYVGANKVRVPAYIDHGRVLVPVRGVFEAIGANVSYSAPHFVVVRKDGAVLAAFIIGRMHAIAGQRAVDLESPPVRRDGRIYVPLRIVAEAAGATVTFRSHPSIVHIETHAPSVAIDAAPVASVAPSPDVDASPSTVDWRVGVAIVTGLCCLGCIVLTARRFAPVLFRPTMPRPRRFAPPLAARTAPSPPPSIETETVALTSVAANGEARFHKQIVHETRTIAVPVMREELVIEYAGDGGTVIIEGRALEAGETVRIPLWEERVHVDVTKHVTLKEDIIIGKRRITATSPALRDEVDTDVAEGNPS